MAVDLEKMRAKVDHILATTTPEDFKKWLNKNKLKRRAYKYDRAREDKLIAIQELARQLNEGYKFMITK
jgi:hypothetical protein